MLMINLCVMLGMFPFLEAEPGLLTSNPVSELISNEGTDDEPGLLIVDVFGFESNTGQAVVVLFSESQWEFPPDLEKAGIVREIEIANLAAHLELSRTDADKYVIMVFHDEDSNCSLDMRNEMVGFSGNISQVTGGPPDFDDLCFEKTDTPCVVRITVSKLEGRPSGSGRPSGAGRPSGGGRPW